MQTYDNTNEVSNIDFLDNTVTDKVNDGIILTQRNTGLKFGTDALFLSAFVPEKAKPTVAAELGSGTGIISLLLLQRKKADKIFAFEVQECYARLTEHNAKQNGFSDRLSAYVKTCVMRVPRIAAPRSISLYQILRICSQTAVFIRKTRKRTLQSARYLVI